MSMTHYMELLMNPLNLLLFMAIPVILAETIAITELHVLYTGQTSGPVRAVNRIAGMIAGVYFTGVFVYLIINAVIPLTSGGQWRGWIDVLAVLSYLAGVVPLGGIALLEFGVIGKGLDDRGKLKLHAIFVAIFLVVAHVAMIFGMLDPKAGGSKPAASAPAIMHNTH